MPSPATASTGPSAVHATTPSRGRRGEQLAGSCRSGSCQYPGAIGYLLRVFGIIRPCRNRLGDELRASWTAHLCGLCLTLRDRHGQSARLVTNYDAVVISALVEAQTAAGGRRRAAGPCPLRGMQRASVVEGDGAQLAAAVSLLLASAKIADHVEDGDLVGAMRVRAARRVADRFADAGRADAASLALDADLLLDAVAGQGSAELRPTSILDVTAPTEAATAAAFAHTAVVAGRPGNADALAEAGRLFGRLAHLLPLSTPSRTCTPIASPAPGTRSPRSA